MKYIYIHVFLILIMGYCTCLREKNRKIITTKLFYIACGRKIWHLVITKLNIYIFAADRVYVVAFVMYIIGYYRKLKRGSRILNHKVMSKTNKIFVENNYPPSAYECFTEATFFMVAISVLVIIKLTIDTIALLKETCKNH